MKIPRWLYKAYCAFFNGDKFNEITSIEHEIELRNERARDKACSQRYERLREASTEDLRRMLP